MRGSGTLIGVIGESDADPGTLAVACQVGRAIAQSGAMLVSGGLGGVMAEACRGAKEAGGVTIGILPGSHKGQANPYVDIPIVTGLGEARNLIIVHTADGLVAVRGGYGTLLEMAFALKVGKPLVGIHSWKLARSTPEGSAVELELVEPFPTAATAKEAVDLILASVRSRA